MTAQELDEDDLIVSFGVDDKGQRVNTQIPGYRPPMKFSTYWTLLLMNAMLKTHKGYRKVRAGRYRKGNMLQKGWK